MAKSTTPTAQCYGILIITIFTVALLWIFTPKVIEKTSHWNECEQNSTEVYLKINASSESTYDTIKEESERKSLDDSVISEIEESCVWHKLKITLYWIVTACVILGWVVITLLIIYSSVIFASNAIDKTEDDRHKHCITLRAQYWQYQCSRFKSKFSKNPMLRKLDAKNSFDKQILSYINAYLNNAWNIRPKEYTRYEENEKNYSMHVRHVFCINNKKVWDKYEGDKSSLNDIVHNLSSIKLENIIQASSIASFSIKTDCSSLKVNCDSLADNLSERSGNASDGNPTHKDEAQCPEIEMSLGVSEGDNDDGEEDGASTVSSEESIPLLARSWRLSVRSASIGPSHQAAMTENCMFLLHGTQIENATGIIEHGFDMSRAAHDTFGKRISLSESSWVADKYTDSKQYPRDRNLVMFIMRTSLKHAYWRVNDEHVPPSIAKNHDGLVSGTKKGYRQFRVFKTKCCYPEFMVLYDRVYPSVFGFPWEETTSL